ncbi:NTP transferase domain-containing protein [Cryobacterium sp. 1639]|uniref:molybdenum cofactor guanylyltransferase n=1 Tax=Cryobacterium inferilacus TaxID=2866629 RepID=UPI001C7387D1|nr:NTP transferase domain-containing protein [Cryobacterium sp. 1639]MBX0300001.1 NTP transferase domain-containing protein [Cryobacterium sp. 1639]
MPRTDTPSTPSEAERRGGSGLRWDAIIVAGGRAKRLGGIDKTALVWRGRSLLDGVVAASTGSRRTCVVGSDANLPADVVRAVEQPRWGGPAAAMVAGLDALARESGDVSPGAGSAGTGSAGADWVVVLAGDLVRADEAVPYLLAELDRLLTAAQAGAAAHRTIDGLISVDAGGRRQPLLAVYRRAALHSSALLRAADNLSVMSLIGPLNLVELRLPDALADDVDTPADAARLGIVLPPPSAPLGTPQHER